MNTHIKRRPRSVKQLKRPVKKGVVIDMPRIYWIMGLLMSKHRRRYRLAEIAAILGVTDRTMRHIMDGDNPARVPALNKLIAFMRSEGFAIHPSDFLEDVVPSTRTKKKSTSP